MSNAVKHAKASKVIITLYGDEELITLTVEDNGVGIDETTQSTNGLGLRTMACRTSIIGATFHVGPDADKGTRVICSFKSDAHAR